MQILQKKKCIVWTTNMAALSHGHKPRIWLLETLHYVDETFKYDQ